MGVGSGTDALELVLRAINVTKSRLESIEEVQGRILEVLNYIDRERLIVSPDCGLGLFSLELAEKKLKIMCEAVKNV